MSFAYDQYLAEHIGNVNKGLHWMLDNLGFKEEKPELEIALVNFDHDESKYSVEEYDAYDKYFYGGNRSYKVVQEFNYAWLHHIHNNPHHWQYWVLLEDDPESGMPYKALEIPVHVIFEMIADWWSFSWKSGNLFEIFNWYADHRSKQIINPKSREIVEYILERIWKVLIMQETIAGHDISEIEKQYRRFWAEQEVDLLNWDHPSAQVIGKVIDMHETENGLEATVEHSDDHLEHHGILGQKWGIRRYQNLDGSYTEEGKARRREIEADVRKAVDSNREKASSIVSSGEKLSDMANDLGDQYTKAFSSFKVTDKVKNQLLNDMHTDLGDGADDEDFFKWTLDEKIWSNLDSFLPDSVKEARAEYEKAQEEYWNDVESFAQDVVDKYKGTTVVDAENSFINAGEDVARSMIYKNLDTDWTGYLSRHFDDYWVYDTPEFDSMVEKIESEVTMDDYNKKFGKSDSVSHSDIKDSDEGLFGIPELKKYPMPDKKHVKSAIRFFNYVDPKYEKELAEAILEKAKEFGLVFDEDISVGDENRLKKYLPEKKEES